MSENFLQMLDSSSNHSELLAGELPANWPVIHARRPSVDFQVWASNENIFFIFLRLFYSTGTDIGRNEIELGPDLQNILRQSYDCLTTMPKLRSTYYGRLIYKTSYEGRKAFLRYDSLAKL